MYMYSTCNSFLSLPLSPPPPPPLPPLLSLAGLGTTLHTARAALSRVVHRGATGCPSFRFHLHRKKTNLFILTLYSSLPPPHFPSFHIFSLPPQNVNEFPWLAYFALCAEQEFEEKEGIWKVLLKNLKRDSKLSIDAALKVSLVKREGGIAS